MKTGLFILSFLLVLSTFAQNSKPTELKLVGSNFSYAKGNIDVEVLTQIIQQKQEEVAQRAFRNLVLGSFEKKPGANKSFTTYFYIYNILHTITAEKNKTVITRQIINNLLEYCLVYGFTNQFLNSDNVKNEKYNFIKNDSIIPINLADISQELISFNRGKGVQSNFLKSESYTTKAFNMYLDMAYDIFLTDKSQKMQERGLFKSLQDSPTLKEWYNNDNAYKVNDKNPKEKDLKDHRILMDTSYQRFITESFGGTDLLNVYSELDKTDFKQETLSKTQYDALKKILRLAISQLKNYSENNVIATISEFLLDYTLVEYKEETIKADSIKRGILYIDAEGLITSLYDKFSSSEKRSTISKKNWFITPRPFLIIGATHSGAISSGNNLIDTEGKPSDLNNIYFANEKIGIKFTFTDKKYTRSFLPGEPYKFHGKTVYWKRPQKEPLILKHELMFYGSGLLYNIVDIKSRKNFNYTLVGTAYGVTFFNGLLLNAGISIPTNANNGIDLNKKMMYNISFDIPIIEYVTAVRKKRN